MGDPTNRNDPEFSRDPHYVWSGGRWQYVQDPSAQSTTDVTHVGAQSAGTDVHEPFGLARIGQQFDNFFSGNDPDAAARANSVLARSPSATPISNYWDPRLRDYGAQSVANPYDAQVADQSRASQIALIQQMRGQMNGPSLAGLQGQRGVAQAGQQALMQGGRAGMLGAAQAAGGLAGDTAQARAAEIMRAQAGMGGAAGNLRGADLRSAEAQARAGLGADTLTGRRQQFALGQGLGLSDATYRNALENFKFGKRIEADANKRAANTRDQVLDVFGTYMAMLAGAGGKK